MKKLFSWKDCTEFDINQVHNLYRRYVNKTQVDLIGSFGFGRTLATHAEGMYIYTQDGRKILDFTGGVGVLDHGHNHPRILQARMDFQEQKRMEVHKNFLSPYIAALSHNIAQLLPEDLDISYFCNSGAEAVEGAVKLAYKYFNGTRKHILHSDISYHGKLLGAAGLTGSPELHFRFPTIPNTHAFAYNDINDLKSQVNSLRKKDGGSDVYAIIIEPMNTSSLRECSTAFLRELRVLCDKEGIVLIFDEVCSGWGKTGELFYFLKHGVIPDIVTMAKAIGGGKSSIAGYTARTPLFNGAYGNFNDALLHSTTYNGYGEECVTAIEAINIIIEERFPEKAQRIFSQLNPGLEKLKDKYPDLIKEVRGSGALNAILLNSEIPAPLNSLSKLIPNDFFKNQRFMGKLMAAAVISELFNTHGILTFYSSNREVPLIIAPALIATTEQLDLFLSALDKTLAIGKYNLLYRLAAQKYLPHTAHPQSTLQNAV